MVIRIIAIMWLTSVLSSQDQSQEINKQVTSTEAYTELMKNLITVTLSGENVFFIYDPQVEHYIDMTTVSRWANLYLKSYVLTSWDKLQHILQQTDTYFFKTSSFVFFFLHHGDPTKFLNMEELSVVWTPYNLLILLGVEPSNLSHSVLSQGIVEKSLFVASVEPHKVERDHFVLYQMDHNIPGKVAYGGNKKLLGIYTTEAFRTKTELFGGMHLNLSGGIIDVAAWCNDAPYLFPGDAGCEGINVEFLQTIANKYEFQLNIQWNASDGQWGSKTNGTWNGLLAEMKYHGKQLTVNMFHLTEDRYKDFDITYPHYMDGFGIVLKNPPPLSKWRGLFYPLSTTVWWLFISTTVAVIGLVTAMFYLLQESQSYDTAFLLVLAAVVRQSYQYHIDRPWVKVWLVLWWWTTFVLACVYTSNLVAYLTIPVVSPRIETVQGLIKANLRILMEDYGSFLPDMLRASEDISLRNLGNKIEFFPSEADSYVDFGFPKVLAGTHAIVESYSHLFYKRYEADMYNCTYFMKEQVYPGYMTWLLPKNSPRTDMLSKELQRLVEAGLVTKLYEEFLLKVPHGQEESGSRAMQMEHFQGHFMILALGLLVSTVSFAVELVYHSYRSSTARCTE